jgi:hypothetical protein
MGPDVIKAGEFDLSGMLAGIKAEADARGARRIVFDAVDALRELEPLTIFWTSSAPACTRLALKERLNPTGPRGFYPPAILFDHIVPGTDNGGFRLRLRPFRIPPSGLRQASRVDLRRQLTNL